MCPDRQILSIYFDGELDSPWKEKLESHLESCPSCRKHLAAYQFTRQRLAETPAGMEQALERIWEKSNFTAKRRLPVLGKLGRRFWNGSITIPVPAAAAAGLVMVLTLAALIALRQPATPEPHLAGLEMQEMIPASDMASLFQYLGNDNSTDVVIIRLPDTTFKRAGEPQMLRAADYQGSAHRRRSRKSQ